MENEANMKQKVYKWREERKNLRQSCRMDYIAESLCPIRMYSLLNDLCFADNNTNALICFRSEPCWLLVCMHSPTSFSRALLWKNNEILWMSSDFSHCLEIQEDKQIQKCWAGPEGVLCGIWKLFRDLSWRCRDLTRLLNINIISPTYITLFSHYHLHILQFDTSNVQRPCLILNKHKKRALFSFI